MMGVVIRIAACWYSWIHIDTLTRWVTAYSETIAVDKVRFEKVYLSLPTSHYESGQTSES